MDVVLGGGLTGLSAAYRLSKNGYPTVLIEKEKELGGLAKTIKIENYSFDYGPHRFHTKSKPLLNEVKELLGEELIKEQRKSQILLNGRYIDYPLSFMNSLSALEISTIVRIAFDYFAIKVGNFFRSIEAKTFEEWVVNDFGWALYDIYFRPYTEKVWGMPCSNLSSDWATQRIQNLSLMQVIKQGIFKPKDGPRTAATYFYYPRSGIGTLSSRYGEKIEELGGTILTNSKITSIQHNGELKSILLEGDKKIPCRSAISTIPLESLINLLEPKPPEEVLKSVEKLDHRAIVFVFLVIQRDKFSDNHWTYFPQKNVSFARISEMKNFSESLFKKGECSLTLEYMCNTTDEIWHMNEKGIINKSIAELVELGLIKENEILVSFVKKVPYAYPTYKLGYVKHLDRIMDYLKGFKNLHIGGRNGLHRYNNMDHAIIMGAIAAENAIGTKREIDIIGGLNEYFG